MSPFDLIGRSFISQLPNRKGPDTIYSGTITEYTGYTGDPPFHFRYLPDELDSSPGRYSFMLGSEVQLRMKINEKN